MENEKIKARDIPPTVVRLKPALRAELDRMAFVNGRSLSKEIAARLEQSLLEAEGDKSAPSGYTAPHVATVIHTNEKSPDDALSDTDRAMLAVFHSLPVQKQLALLSLFQ